MIDEWKNEWIYPLRSKIQRKHYMDGTKWPRYKFAYIHWTGFWVTPILIICFCQHCVKRETRNITTKIVTFIPKIISPTTLTNHSHGISVTSSMKFLAAFGATRIKEFVSYWDHFGQNKHSLLSYVVPIHMKPHPWRNRKKGNFTTVSLGFYLKWRPQMISQLHRSSHIRSSRTQSFHTH